MLLDPRLQRRLTGDEFKAFINLMVWAVSLVSDGAFAPDDAEMIVEREHINRLLDVGVVEKDDEDNHRIAETYWSWQTSTAELEKMQEQRKKDRERKAQWRANQQDEFSVASLPADKQIAWLQDPLGHEPVNPVNL